MGKKGFWASPYFFGDFVFNGPRADMIKNKMWQYFCSAKIKGTLGPI
jgi:hypothetical protein